MIHVNSKLRIALESLSYWLESNSVHGELDYRRSTDVFCLMSDLNNALMRIPEYHRMLGVICAKQSDDSWVWQKILHECDVKVGLLKVFNTHAIPLHDHPGASGASMVLDGSVEVSKYQVDTRLITDSDCFQRLSRVGRNVLHRNDVTIYTRERGNVHELRSVTRSCLLLCYQSPVYEESDRSWYFPIGNSKQSKLHINTKRLQSGFLEFA